MPPAQIGGSSTYSDPIADAEEESAEVVDGFFSENADYEREIKECTLNADGQKGRWRRKQEN